MGNSMEKVYDIMYRDNDKYARIYGDPSAQKIIKVSKDKVMPPLPIGKEQREE